MPTIDVILQFATLVALLAGIVFGILEIRRAAKARAEKAALDVFDITVQQDVMDALTTILQLPVEAEADAVRSSNEATRAAALLMNLFEYWGVMVFFRVVPLRTLDLLVGSGPWLVATTA